MLVKLCATDSIVARITLWMVFVCSEQVPQLWHHEAYRRAICRLCQIFSPKLFRSPNRLAVKQVSIHQRRGYLWLMKNLGNHRGECRTSEVWRFKDEKKKLFYQTRLLLMYRFTSAPQVLHVSFVPSNPKLYCVMLTARNSLVDLFVCLLLPSLVEWIL